MIANKAWGIDAYRATVECDVGIFASRGAITLVLRHADTRSFDLTGNATEWRAVHRRIGEELAKYPEPCHGCSCSPCQCREQGRRLPLFAAQRDYLAALKRAEEAEGRIASKLVSGEGADMNAMYAREAADTAYGIFARMAAAEGMVASLDGTMGPT